MSNITKATTLLKCVKTLKKACDELGIELVQDAKQKGVKGRSYYRSSLVGDHIARLKGPYDVAFNRQANGTFEASTDWHGGHVAREVGENYSRLTDVYTAHKLTDKARAKGLFVTRTVNRNGGIRLTVTGGKL